jgi:two-component system, OmpR family, heavy metal sensor histidine kinase CusS
MLLKNANWSIVQCLTALYAASTLAILLIISFALYESLEHNLSNEIKGQLVSHYQIVAGLIKKQSHDKYALIQEIQVEPMLTENITSRNFSRVIGSDGQLLFSTTGMNDIVPLDVAAFHSSAMKNYGAGEFASTYYQGKKFLILTKSVKLASGKYNTIQVSKSMDAQRRLLNKYRRMIMFMLILGAILSIVLGSGLARKSMQPINKVTKKLKELTTEQLHERLDEKKLPGELIALAAAFNSMCDGLEQSFNRLKQFSSDLAHELRTPITNLIGEAEIALSQTRSEKEYQQVLISSLEEYQRISKMVSGLLFLAQADSPQTKLVKQVINARETIDSVCDFYSALAEEKSIEINCNGQATILVDEMLFRRVINNVLANAIKYSSASGLITFDLVAGKKDTVISIADQGAGIDDKDLPLIFDRFYRTDKARTQGSGGLGLGLAIVKSIMDLHGATISFESELGKGTIVKLVFLSN